MIRGLPATSRRIGRDWGNTTRGGWFLTTVLLSVLYHMPYVGEVQSRSNMMVGTSGVAFPVLMNSSENRNGLNTRRSGKRAKKNFKPAHQLQYHRHMPNLLLVPRQQSRRKHFSPKRVVLAERHLQPHGVGVGTPDAQTWSACGGRCTNRPARPWLHHDAPHLDFHSRE